MAWDMRSLQKLQRDTGFKADFLEKTFYDDVMQGIFSIFFSFLFLPSL
jgi:hypothetical protein